MKWSHLRLASTGLNYFSCCSSVSICSAFSCITIAKIIPFFVFITILTNVHSQEMLGIVNSNYAGTNSILVNPANAAASRYQLSINLLAGDLFFNSNYLYIHKKDYGFFKFFSVNMDDPAYMYIYDYPEYNYTDTVHYIDYLKNTVKRAFYGNLRFAGPSVTYRQGNHAFTLVTGFRNNFSIEKMPNDAANFIFRGQDFAPQHNITYEDGFFTMAVLSWVELGLSYANTFYLDGEHEFSAGITLKGLLGTGGAYGIVHNATYMVPNTDSIYFYRMNAVIGLSMPMDYTNNEFVLDPLIKGYGFSADVGITYNLKGSTLLPSSSFGKNNSDPEDDYLLKAGISALDMGWINFNKEVQVHEFQDVDNRLWSGLRSFHANSIQHFLRSASQNLLGDSLASLTNQTRFSMFLPSAASVQVDYNFGSNIFLNATLFQGIRLGKRSVRRPSLLAVTPRYETPMFGISLPVTLYDFREPTIGLAFRIYSLVVGTERLGTFLTLTDIEGMDVYFSVGINLNPKKSDWKYKSSRSTPCESYENYKRYRVR